jgi:hypothetical protein
MNIFICGGRECGKLMGEKGKLKRRRMTLNGSKKGFQWLRVAVSDTERLMGGTEEFKAKSDNKGFIDCLKEI